MSPQPPTPGGTVDDFLRTTRVLGFAMVAAVLTYMVIALVVAPTLIPQLDAPTLRILAVVFGAVSLTILGFGQVLFRRLVESARRRATPDERLGAYRSAVIIGMAFKESVAIFGLVLSLLSGEPRWAIGFGAVALVAMSFSWPQRTTMEALAADVPPIG